MFSTEQYSKIFRLISAATVNNTLFNGAPTWVGRVLVTNTAATMRFLKFYDKATAPVAGTDTPVLTVGIPTLSSGTFLISHKFVNGLGIAITANIADNDNTAVALNDVAVNIKVR